MESLDSSPNYMRATSSFDAKKEYSPQGGSECDDMISATSSTCGSVINGPYAPKLNHNGTKHRTTKTKTIKNFGNIKSFRRRAKSRIIHQSPATISDEDSLVDSSESSPNYLKATSCSQGKKMQFSESPSNDRNSSNSSRSKLAPIGHKSSQTLSRTSSSLRNVRILIKTTSFKPKRGLLNYPKVSEDVAVTRATYSSTLRDSKLPQPVELRPRGAESESTSAVKVCRYHHCSLHGHCHGTHDPVSQTKRFLYKRRWSLKKQKSVIPKTELGRGGEKHNSDKKKNFQKSDIISVVERVNQDENGVDCYEEICPKPEIGLVGDRYENIQGLDFVEVAFGETSFPERSYQESLSISRKYSLYEQEFGGKSFGTHGYCSRCSCHNGEQVTSNPKRANGDLSSREAISPSLNKNNSEDVVKKPNEQVGNYIEDSLTLSSRSNEKSNKDCLETPVIYDEVTEKKSEFSSSSNSRTSNDINSEEEGDSTTESTPADDFKVNKVTQVYDSETNSLTQEGSKLQLSKPRHISMWNLIHQHMSSNLVAETPNKPLEGAERESPVESTISGRDLSDSEMGKMSNVSDNQEIELRKMFAIKLVREAIEKILLPEVQDQTPDDQSVTSESTPRTEILERDRTEAFTEEKLAESDAADKEEGNVSSNPKQESSINDTKNEKGVVRKSEKKAPKHWSNLKKWILLQRFIRELEKVRKFNPKKPQLLPLNRDPEAEKVNLRPQTVDGRKNAEEWMLDYALRQAVGQLAPTQKRKVALLVKAFETVAPTKEDDPQVQYRIPRLKSDESVFEGKNHDDSVSALNSVNKESGLKKAEKLYHLSDNYGESLKKFQSSTGETQREATRKLQYLQENAIIANPVEGKTEESGRSIQTDQKTHIKMWHMIYQHVVSGIAEKVGSQLLHGVEDDEVEDNISPNDDYSNDLSRSTNDSSEKNHVLSGFTKSDALKLVKEAVDEILLPEIQDDSSDTQSVTSERNCTDDGAEEESQIGKKSEVVKPRNWSKLKKLILLKRSIKALEKARNAKPQEHQLVPQTSDHEPEKIDLRSQMTDERKKAEQWMLDYAVQHIVTKLTPARKRRVFMLVEAFEAVVPLPEM